MKKENFVWKKSGTTRKKWNAGISKTIVALREALVNRAKSPQEKAVAIETTNPKSYIVEGEDFWSEEFDHDTEYTEICFQMYLAFCFALYSFGKKLAKITQVRINGHPHFLDKLILYRSPRPMWFTVFGLYEMDKGTKESLLGNTLGLDHVWSAYPISNYLNRQIPISDFSPRSIPTEETRKYELRRIFPPTLAGIALLAEYLEEVLLSSFYKSELEALFDQYRQLARKPNGKDRAVQHILASYVGKAFESNAIRLPIVQNPSEDKKKDSNYIGIEEAIPLMMASLERRSRLAHQLR